MLLRQLLPTDISQCLQLVQSVWSFGGFASPDAADSTALWYLHHHLQPSTHSFVLESDHHIAGYLTCTIPGHPAFCESSSWQALGDTAEKAWHCATTDEERRQFLSTWFFGDTHVQRVLTQADIRAQDAVWVQLFIVSPQFQGQGLGRRLWQAFCDLRQKLARERWVLLHTDTWCGWQFYEHRGMRRLASRPMLELDALPDGTQPAYFLYGQTPENRIGVRTLCPQPLPHHPPCGSAVGGYQ